MIAAPQAPSPLPTSFASLEAQREHRSAPPLSTLNGANDALRAKREQWATLDLRQQWADEVYMRGHLRAAGVCIKYSSEPATASRLRSILRRAGVHSPEVRDSVGTDPAGYLQLNPGLPLWAAVAIVLEGTGRFTPGIAGSHP